MKKVIIILSVFFLISCSNDIEIEFDKILFNQDVSDFLLDHNLGLWLDPDYEIEEVNLQKSFFDNEFLLANDVLLYNVSTFTKNNYRVKQAYTVSENEFKHINFFLNKKYQIFFVSME